MNNRLKKPEDTMNAIVRFEVLTAVKMSVLLFWVMMLCGIVGRYQCFGGGDMFL
jgi:hypothetical protein